MLDFVELSSEVWILLLECSDRERRVYMALYFHSNLYTCKTHVLKIADIAKHSKVNDTSVTYKILSALVERGMIEKLDCDTGLQYKFLHHVPKNWKPKSDVKWV